MCSLLAQVVANHSIPSLQLQFQALPARLSLMASRRYANCLLDYSEADWRRSLGSHFFQHLRGWGFGLCLSAPRMEHGNPLGNSYAEKLPSWRPVCSPERSSERFVSSATATGCPLNIWWTQWRILERTARAKHDSILMAKDASFL